jgi:hypothetical protein
MCWKCQEIDKKIDHYNKLRSQVLDEQTVEGIDSLAAELEAEKLALHPDGSPDKSGQPA